jgi:glycosyltransferase involved in cell wall biosynthesis
MEMADRIIAVSHYTKGLITSRYGIPAAKVAVVHNAVDRREAEPIYHVHKRPGKKIVLFMGRFTFQKGPEYFVEAAAKVLAARPEVSFIMAGAGDLLPQMIERVAERGIGRRVHFTGFLDGADIERVFALSDLYVMPSVSEPFGITPLEAMLRDVPVIISKQSGVGEVLRHVPKVDFWDVDALAATIVAILTRPDLAADIVARSREELEPLRWENAARKVIDVYRTLFDPSP